MANSLLTGVSGLTSHQKMIEVVGHNLANLNTTAFKSRHVTFSDVFYETIRNGTGSNGSQLGGSNPAQIGYGSKLANVAVQHTQGGFDSTGGQFDFAIDGNGFFVLDSNEGLALTRSGTFGLDANGILVDTSTGYSVQRFGSIGDSSTLGPSFQTPGSPEIRIPIGAPVPGELTRDVSLRGNLSPASNSGVTHVLSTTSAWTTGGIPVVSSTLLNNLDFSTSPYVPGDTLEISGLDRESNVVSQTLAVDGTTTVQDLLDAIDATFPTSTVTLEPDGNITMTESTTGQSFTSMLITDGSTNSGSALFSSHLPETSVSGVDPDIVRATTEIFDVQGTAHHVNLELQKMTDGSWTLTATMDPSAGTVIDGLVDQIQFNSSTGTFEQAGTPGIGDTNLVIQFSGVSTPQAIRIDFGDPGTLSGLTSNIGVSSVSTESDGVANGTLVSTNVDEAGIVEGIASNGRRFPLAQLAVASFRNPNGLESDGNNLYRATSSSGALELGPARSGGRGGVLAGQLEQSNVDIAVEFTRLIIAQRGFSANARTITVTDEILEELTNLLR